MTLPSFLAGRPARPNPGERWVLDRIRLLGNDGRARWERCADFAAPQAVVEAHVQPSEDLGLAVGDLIRLEPRGPRRIVHGIALVREYLYLSERGPVILPTVASLGVGELGTLGRLPPELVRWLRPEGDDWFSIWEECPKAEWLALLAARGGVSRTTLARVALGIVAPHAERLGAAPALAALAHAETLWALGTEARDTHPEAWDAADEAASVALNAGPRPGETASKAQIVNLATYNALTALQLVGRRYTGNVGYLGIALSLVEELDGRTTTASLAERVRRDWLPLHVVLEALAATLLGQRP